MDFTEEKDVKGFGVVELDESATPGRRLKDFQFHPVAARPFLTIDSYVPDGELDPTSRVIADVGRHDVADAIVRLRIHVSPESESLLRDGEIHRSLESAHHIASVTREVARERRTRIPAGTEEGLTPLKALSLYFDSRNLEAGRKDKLMLYAKELLERADEIS